MKLTWKRSESSKKRPISHFPNLPFSDDASENLSVEVSSFPKEESPRNDDVQEKTAAAILNGDGETLRLAHSFQEQGNKLAEVTKKKINLTIVVFHLIVWFYYFIVWLKLLPVEWICVFS